MKKKKIISIVALSTFSLVCLVVLQINWIQHAAQLRESQLKHRTTMASQLVMYHLKNDEGIQNSIIHSMEENNAHQLIIPIQQMEYEKIDSLLEMAFHYYHINLNYEFDVVDKRHKGFVPSCEATSTSHRVCLEDFLDNQKAELRITFLNKNRYIYAQMGWMLIASVILIILIAGSLIITIFTIWKQKKISEMTSDFINNMTHEFKTPIATVSLASNMLRKDKVIGKTDKVKHYAGIIQEENLKLQSQVEQVLRIARLERGEFKLNKTQADLHEIIQNAIRTVDLQVRSKGGQVKCYLNAMRQEIMADVSHLGNVISNLLDNANKYSPENPEIIVSTYDKEDGIVVSVEDKGIGMSKDKQKHIFNKFYRVPTGNLHDVKGFGLGLAYVKMMIDAHKGNIQLESEVGKGSRFDIFLPNASNQ